MNSWSFELAFQLCSSRGCPRWWANLPAVEAGSVRDEAKDSFTCASFVAKGCFYNYRSRLEPMLTEEAPSRPSNPALVNCLSYLSLPASNFWSISPSSWRCVSADCCLNSEDGSTCCRVFACKSRAAPRSGFGCLLSSSYAR